MAGIRAVTEAAFVNSKDRKEHVRSRKYASGQTGESIATKFAYHHSSPLMSTERLGITKFPKMKNTDIIIIIIVIITIIVNSKLKKS